METLLSLDWMTVWTALASVITGATLAAKGLRIIASLTKTDKDDKVLDVVLALLDKVAINNTVQK